MDAIPRLGADMEYGPDITGADAFSVVIRSALQHLEANIPLARAGEVEGTHQLRVAIRRSRAALALFRPVLPHETTRALGARLRDLGRVVGRARDWDVFATETLARARDDLDSGGMEPLASATEIARTCAQSAVFAVLGQREFLDLLRDMAAFPEQAAQAPAHSPRASLDRKLIDIAPALLDKLYRKVAKRGRRIRHATHPELHELRKRIKTLRYGIEFLSPLYGQKRVKTLLKSCRELQDLLGRVNDGAATAHLAQGLIQENSDVDLALAVAAISGWAEDGGTKAHDHLSQPWRRLRRAKPFW